MRILKLLLCFVGSFFMSGCQTESLVMPEKFLLFDVRTLEEYQGSHLAGAVLMPVDTVRERIGVLAPNKSVPIYLYCHSGGRASVARRTMEQMGYTNVISLGGISSASKKVNLPVIH